MLIETIYQRNVMEPYGRESFFTEATTVGECLPAGVEFDGRGVFVQLERRASSGLPARVRQPTAPSELVEPGEKVVVSLRPGFELTIGWQIIISLATMAASALLAKSLAGKLGNQVEDEKKNESYRGFKNSFTPGGVIPIILGERRVAPPVVGRIVESSFAPYQLSNGETLRMLLAVCHGPIRGFGSITGQVATHEEFVTLTGSLPLQNLTGGLSPLIGLEINDQEANNFADVSSEWRTGEVEQDAILGFPDSDVDIAVEQSLAEYSEAIDISDTGKPAGVYSAGSDIDPNLGISLAVVMSDEADRFVITIFFQSGLYKDAGGGGLAPTTAKFRLQYFPVDSGGTRTGDTVLLPEIAISGAEQQGQIYQFPASFFSPDSYIGAAQFGYIYCDKPNYAKVAGPINAAIFPPSFADRDALKFSIACWVRAEDNAIGVRPIFIAQKGEMSGGFVIDNLWPWYPNGDTPTSSGTMICIERPAIDPGSGIITKPWSISMYVWRGYNDFSVYQSVAIEGPIIGEWRHIGLTWDGATSTLVFYLDGLAIPVLLVKGLQNGDAPLVPLKPAFFEEGSVYIGGVGPASYNKHCEDVSLCDIAIANGVKPQSWFFAGALNVDELGHNLSPYDPDLDPDLLFASHLSEEIASGKIEQLTFPGSTTAGEVIELVGTPLAAAPQGDSPVWFPESGIPLRGRYRLELYRSNPVLEDPLNEINAAQWKSVTLITDEDFQHPKVAKFAVSIDADDQVSNAQPNVSMIVRGALVKVWDGFNAAYPTFAQEWSRNPAWNILHVITEEEIGLGSVWQIEKNIDLAAWKVFADRCEEGVEDAAGTPAFFDGDFVAPSTDHPYGEVHFKIGILDNTGAPTGESLPKTWMIGHTVRIKTASDASWLVASLDESQAARLTITSIRWESEDAATNGYQHWVQIEADWVDGYTLPNANNVTGTATGIEDRHQCDALLQEKGADGWSTVVEILRSFRAAPIVIGNKLSVYVQRPRPVDWTVTQAQMVPDSFSRRWSGISDRYNSLQLDFVDRDKNYETDFLTEDHPSISGTVAVGSIRKAPAQTVRAVTRRTEVRRQAIFLLNEWFLLRQTASFKIGYEGVGFAVGDRVEIAHDAVLVGFSGRVYADSGAATEITLDRDVTVTFGNTYEIVVRSNSTVDSDAKEVRETASIDASMIPGSGSLVLAAGSTITLTSPGFENLSPMEGDIYSFGETGTATKDFTVVRVTFNPADYSRQVDLIEYDEDVFVDNEFGVLDDDPGQPLPPSGFQGGAIKRPGDNNGHVGGGLPGTKESTRIGVDGKPQSILGVTWTKPSFNGAGASNTGIWSAVIEAGRPITPQMEGIAPAGATSFEINAGKYRPGQRVRVFVQHLDRNGRGRPPIACPRSDVFIGGRVNTPAAPTIVTPKGRQTNAVYSVTFPTGVIPEGVEVRVGGWLLGQKVAAALRDGDLVSPQWVYGADNSEAQGAYTHQVRSLLPNGQVSHAATFTNDDLVPLGAAVESSTAHEDAWASGTLSGLQIDSSYTPPALKFTGSGLEGTFETPTLDLGVAKRWQIEVAAAGHQVHPTVLEDLNEPINSRLYANWLLEGPTGGEDSLMSRLVIEWKPSDTGTPSSTWATFRPGEHYVRSAKFRLRVVRPTAAFDCRVFRFGVRALEIAAFEPGDIDAGTY